MASTQDLAILSGDAYKDRTLNETCGNWVVKQSSSVAENGFSATLYQNAITGELVISYAGTDGGWDYVSDVNIGAKLIPLQYDSAREFYDQCLALNLGPISAITGHSLGGALAQLIGNETTVHTETFNAPGVNGVRGLIKQGSEFKEFVEQTGADITNYLTAEDGIGNVGIHMGKCVYAHADPSKIQETSDNFELSKILGRHAILQWSEAAYTSDGSYIPSSAGFTIEDALEAARVEVYELLANIANSATGAISGIVWSALEPFAENLVATASKLLTPIVLDLNGNGIETTALTKGVFFDLDANGFAEQTGWVSANDGFLVLDKNGDGTINDGTELFGDHTILNDGTTAANGFMALAELDDNKDGKIDSTDSVFSKLTVWRDLNSDGVSETGELYSLDQLGITSLNTTYATGDATDSAGNVEKYTSSFIRQDGTSSKLSDYYFATNPTFTIAKEYKDVPADVQQLPELSGYGNVYDLWQAIVRDTSGELKALVQSFVDETDDAARSTILDNLLYKWTNSDTLDPTSRGAYMDARQLHTLESLYGSTFYQSSWSSSNPVLGAAQNLQIAYQKVKEYYDGMLMAQTHVSTLFDDIKYSVDANGAVAIDWSIVQGEIQDDLRANYASGALELKDFVTAARAIGFSSKTTGFSSFCNYFQMQNEELATIMYSVGRTAVYGGSGNDTLQVDDSLSSYDFLLIGQDGNDSVYGNGGNDVLLGGNGNDTLYGNAGNDILDGGAGNDVLYGGIGNDTYVWGTGSGNDIIDNSANQSYDAATNTYIWNDNGQDTVQFGTGLTRDSVGYGQNGDDLIITNNTTGETLTVTKWFVDDIYKVETFQFSDGTKWTADEITSAAVVQGSSGNDYLYGSNYHDDRLYGGAGDDTLYGYAGNDIVDGGAGNDYLDGGTGNDTYVWGTGSGNDRIDNSAGQFYDAVTSSNTWNDNGQDTVQFGPGLSRDSVEYRQSGEDIILTNNTTGETLTVMDWFVDDIYAVETFQFTDGTKWTADEITSAAVVQGGSGNDTLNGSNYRDDKLYGNEGNDFLYGNAGDDSLYGGAGDDYLTGGAGNDTLDGGAGNDNLYGGTGNDTYVWGTGSGNDTIDNSAGQSYDAATNSNTWNDNGQDTIQFGTGLSRDSVDYRQSGENIILTNNTTGEALTVTNWFVDDRCKVESFQFTDGTKWTADDITSTAVVQSGSGNDNLNGSNYRDDRIYGGTGNDSIYGNSGTDSLYGEAGNDYLSGDAGDDSLYGGAGDDYLNGGAGNDILDGGSGADNLYGGAGDDTYIFGEGSGNDQLSNYVDSSGHGMDTLQFEQLNQAAVEFTVNGNDLLCTVSQTGDGIRIQNWALGVNYQVDTFSFADGSLSAADVNKKLA